MFEVEYLQHNIFHDCTKNKGVYSNADLIRLLQDGMITIINAKQIFNI